MIKLTTFQINTLSKSSVEAFYIVEVGYKTNEVVLGNTVWQTDYKRLSTFQRDITLSDGRTFIGNSPIIELQPPKISSVVDREQYIITLADVNYEYGVLSENNLVGMPAQVGIVFIDYDTKEPNLDANEVLIVYKGQIDAASYLIETSEIGSTVYKLACASPVANLEAVKSFYTSKSFLKDKIRSDDVSFDQVAQGTGSLRLKWGRT
jgi:hypothetical protein